MVADGSSRTGLGVGCTILAAIGLVLGAIGAIWVYRRANLVERELRDPVARTARAAALLGTDTLPEGYHALAAFSVPLVLDLAVLTDVEPDAEGVIRDFGERGLIYVEFAYGARQEGRLREFLAGNAPAPQILRENDIGVELDGVLRRGVAPVAGGSLEYVVHPGRFEVQGFGGRGLAATGVVDCPEDPRPRLAIWFGPEPETGELAGTPADPGALAAFFGRFRLCD